MHLPRDVRKALCRQLQCLGVCTSSNQAMTRMSMTFNNISGFHEGGYADLPRDLLVQLVASFANKEEAKVMRGVCRAWRDVFDSTVKCIAVHTGSLMLLPQQVHSFTNLQHLVVSHTNGAAVAAVVQRLAMPSPHLNILEITQSTMSTVPFEVHHLTGLKTLVLSSNRIKVITGSYIHLLPCLEHLDLSSNMLTDLPACIGSLGGTLRKLNVSENQLSYLPEGLGGLAALQTLRASNNLLLELPDSLASLQGLTHLDLSYNRLKSVPDNLSRLTNLHQLGLFGSFSHSVRNEGSITVKVLAQLSLSAPNLHLHAEELIRQLVKVRKRQLKQAEEEDRARRARSQEPAGLSILG